VAKNAALFWPEYFTFDCEPEEDEIKKNSFKVYLKE
jgi:hypothetical protein